MTRILVGTESTPYTPPKIVEIFHNTTHDFMIQNHVCRNAGGEVTRLDNPRKLLLGFLWHQEGKPTEHHLIRFTAIKQHPLSEDVAETLGTTPEDFKRGLSGEIGAKCPLTGVVFEDIKFSPESLAELDETMMWEESGPEGAMARIPVIPELDSQQSAKIQLDRGLNRKIAMETWRRQSENIPEGWTRFVLPWDCEVLIAWHSRRKSTSCGVFRRVGSHGFLVAYDDGAWESSLGGEHQKGKLQSFEEALQHCVVLWEQSKYELLDPTEINLIKSSPWVKELLVLSRAVGQPATPEKIRNLKFQVLITGGLTSGLWVESTGRENWKLDARTLTYDKDAWMFGTTLDKVIACLQDLGAKVES